MAHISNPKPKAEDLCIICGRPYAQLHEVFFGRANRNKSIKHGCQERLCHYHHQDHRSGVHHNREFDLRLKMKHQSILEERMSREEFRLIFGKSWL